MEPGHRARYSVSRTSERIRLPRLAAGALDLGLASLLSIGGAMLLSWFLRGSPSSWLVSYENLASLLLAAVGSTLPTLAYAHMWRRGVPTPAHRMFGLNVVGAVTSRPLSRLASFTRWILVCAPIALWSYPVVVATVFDPGPLLILIRLPEWPFLGALLPAAWYAVLALSVARDRTGHQGFHDRISSSTVVYQSLSTESKHPSANRTMR
jgi:hypothetical protein